MPRPRADGSTSSMRSCAGALDDLAPLASSRAWTRNTQPTLAPSRSAIQQASRARVEAVDEVGGDARDQRLEAHVPAVFLGIERAVALDDPADVAGARRPQQPGEASRDAVAEQRLDLGHGARAGSAARLSASGASRRCDVGRALRSSGAKARLPGGGEAEVEMARVVARALGADQLGVLQRAQQPAQVAGIEIEVARQLGGRCVRLAMRELPEQARLGQREARAGQALVQDADAPRVEAVEAADGVGARWRSHGHRGDCSARSLPKAIDRVGSEQPTGQQEPSGSTGLRRILYKRTVIASWTPCPLPSSSSPTSGRAASGWPSRRPDPGRRCPGRLRRRPSGAPRKPCIRPSGSATSSVAAAAMPSPAASPRSMPSCPAAAGRAAP